MEDPLLDKLLLLKQFSQPEDKLLAAKVLDQADLCIKKHCYSFTNFIDDHRSQKYMTMISKISGLSTMCFGGHEKAERKIIGFCPDYQTLLPAQFPILPLQITPALFSGKLTHRDYLGSILGLGIDRNKVGDIFLYDDSAIALVHADIMSYIVLNLSKVAHSRVELMEISLSEVSSPKVNMKETNTTVLSLRADAVVSAGFHIARGQAADLIHSGKVFINGSLVLSISTLLKEGDLLTVRGIGRIQLHKIIGKTKKDRFSIIIHRYL